MFTIVKFCLLAVVIAAAPPGARTLQTALDPNPRLAHYTARVVLVAHLRGVPISKHFEGTES